ncbi:hypothetical protein DNTS_009943 [Danionella cerebrum]|uniref:BRICHOS domain-containing protein n=1 Tax=Danionella cerebrum TaxID=2873325 RepID=A0A553Q246_9TELE|nr:hypothetical protein DNTS_009943 [Danionella translucida]
MLRCWKLSEATLEESPHTQCGQCLSSSKVPHKFLWSSLAALLLIVVIALGMTANLGLQHKTQASLQVIRNPDRLINQSAVIDQQNSVVTYSVKSQANQTSTVVFDLRQGLVCYKPDSQDSCFLHRMERGDYENVRSQLNTSESQVQQPWVVGNQTGKHTEFLEVIPGSRVEASSLQEPLQSLCQQASVYWTRRSDGNVYLTILSFSYINNQGKYFYEYHKNKPMRFLFCLSEGPGKQRLIYFCIDICFPSNICVSVCFYYLPE